MFLHRQLSPLFMFVAVCLLGCRSSPDAKQRGQHSRISPGFDAASATELYRVRLGGPTYARPVVANDKVFLGTGSGRDSDIPVSNIGEAVFLCLAADSGELLWRASHPRYMSRRGGDWIDESVASTAAVVDDRVYYVSNRGEVCCLDVEGFRDGENDGSLQDETATGAIDADFIWRLDVSTLGVHLHNMAGSSPLVVGDRLYVVSGHGLERDHRTDPNPSAPSFLALDRHSGEVLWTRSIEGILHGQWSSPSRCVAGGAELVLFPAGNGWLYGLDGATGEEIWRFDLNPKDSRHEIGGLGTRNSILATPVVDGHRIYLATGQDPEHGEGPGRLCAIDARGRGDITESGLIWDYGGKDFGRTLSTVALSGSLLYAVDVGGYLHCLDQATGQRLWVHDTWSAVWSSPVVTRGVVLLGDEDGDLEIVEDSRRYRVVDTREYDAPLYSTPVIDGDRLFLPTRDELIVYSLR